jgi:hypothetical protein
MDETSGQHFHFNEVFTTSDAFIPKDSKTQPLTLTGN